MHTRAYTGIRSGDSSYSNCNGKHKLQVVAFGNLIRFRNKTIYKSGARLYALFFALCWMLQMTLAEVGNKEAVKS